MNSGCLSLASGIVDGPVGDDDVQYIRGKPIVFRVTDWDEWMDCIGRFRKDRASAQSDNPYWADQNLWQSDLRKLWPTKGVASDSHVIRNNESVRPARVPAKQSAVDDWYRNYIDECRSGAKSPNGKEDENAARAFFGIRYSRGRLSVRPRTSRVI